MFDRIWSRAGPIAVVNLFYFGLLVYPVLRIWTLLLPLPGTPVLLVIMVGPLLLRIAAEWFPGAPGRALAAMALTWLGICFLAFFAVLLFEVAHLLVPLPAQSWGWLLLATVTLLTGYGFWNAQRLTIKTLDVALPQAIDNGPGEPLRGTRIAQISDVHVGSRSSHFLRRVIRRVNEQDADYVFITGDLVDFRHVSERDLAVLADLEAPTYYCIGNHERYVDLEAICARLTALGVKVLRDASVEVGRLQILGIDDADTRTRVRAALQDLQPIPDRYRILLYHRPDGAEDAASWGVHLMLCGHTHNGQIVPFNMLVRRIFPRICGRYDVEGLCLYVSPGTGTWGPVLRLGSRSEISMIQLN